ncbi:MICAL-like protein 1 isoform X1 [Microplitis demolitor]|uniref:MICAL-like protein 1 isoform X1 n=2 Tax=Microplitis demolitor TaxID=69319 RepID=UPI0004CD7F2B|nr:MICAL-like protein 1 isoform X1 [Microplitis demolitor]XP_008557228.1 MICAL-like protein 1 isoform X1 [Microplitis demolitor]
MTERRGPKALELWCRRITEGYPGVNVQNMTTSWRDGLAFCAMIHHFRPDLIDFSSLNKDDVYGNNELAFRTAEQHLGIPALLDAEDMASCSVPDRLSILTYLSQFYQQFGGSSPSRIARSRTPETSSQQITPAESPASKAAPRLGMRREVCVVCSMPVFLAEKLVISKSTYHRTCFRCARCHNQLTPCSYYETEEGQYCCETCPDEDTTNISVSEYDSLALGANDSSIAIAAAESESLESQDQEISYHRSLSDEEKQLKKLNESKDLKSTSQIASMRLNFMSSHLLSDTVDSESEAFDGGSKDQDVNASPDIKSKDSLEDLKTNLHSMTSRTINDKSVNNLDVSSSVHRCLTATSDNLDNDINVDVDADVNVDDNLIVNDKDKNKDEFKSQDTKEMVGVTGTDVNQCLSIVQKRLKLFEDLVVNVNVIANNNNDRDDKADGDANAGDKDCDSETGVSGVSRMEPDSLEVCPRDDFTITEPVSQAIAKPRDTCVSIINASVESTEVEKKQDEDEDEDGDRGEVETYPDDMNPFKSDEETDGKTNDFERSNNPFDSDDTEEVPKPAARTVDAQSTKRLLKAPLNPFWSDEDHESEEDSKLEVPIPKPRRSKLEKSDLRRDDFYASNSSLASSTSTTPSSYYRKRRPAPPPPDKSVTGTPDKFNDSGIRTPRPRKSKPAPPPPMPTSTPLSMGIEKLSLTNDSPISNKMNINANVNNRLIGMEEDAERENQSWEDIKVSKNEANRTKQSMSRSESNQDYTKFDKSCQGKWKRKKAPAPARPIPQRRKIKVMSMKDVKLELAEIEMQQLGLEKQGVRLEQLIRNKCENDQKDDEDNNESSLSMDADELVLELFALVNEKNELFRRQAELMLLRRQHRLEEEHADIEYQIRCLICQPEATKTDFDKQREEALIQRLVEIVEKRSEIVECLEMDRRREVEEDKSINMHMELYTAKKVNQEEPKTHKGKKIKLKEKLHIKEKNLLKKGHKKDADKDVDETEVKVKRQNKRKWF